MKRHFLQGALSLMGLLVAFAGQAGLAQAGTSGNIAGTIRDAKTGAPVAGVRLQIKSPSQTVETTTDDHGHFVVFALQPDDYTLTAEKDGYDSKAFADYPVFADQTQQYDLQLNPAATTSG
jgi:hypothetical protein